MSNLNRFEPQDITIVKLNGKSTSVWGISPPSKEELIKYLNITSDVKLEFEVTFSRYLYNTVNKMCNTHVISLSNRFRQVHVFDFHLFYGLNTCIVGSVLFVRLFIKCVIS